MLPTAHQRLITRIVALALACGGLALTGCGKVSEVADRAGMKYAENKMANEAAEKAAQPSQNVAITPGHEVNTPPSDAQSGAASAKHAGNGAPPTSDQPNPLDVAPSPAAIKSGESLALPADFPKDIPLYEGLSLALVTAEPQQAAFILAATTPDPVEKVGAFFQEKLVAQGWAEQAPSDSGAESRTLTFTKAARIVTIRIIKTESGTGVQLTTAKEK